MSQIFFKLKSTRAESILHDMRENGELKSLQWHGDTISASAEDVRELRAALIRNANINDFEQVNESFLGTNSMSDVGEKLVRLGKVIRSINKPTQIAAARRYADLIYKDIARKIRNEKGMDGLQDAVSLLNQIHNDLEDKAKSFGQTPVSESSEAQMINVLAEGYDAAADAKLKALDYASRMRVLWQWVKQDHISFKDFMRIMPGMVQQGVNENDDSMSSEIPDYIRVDVLQSWKGGIEKAITRVYGPAVIEGSAYTSGSTVWSVVFRNDKGHTVDAVNDRLRSAMGGSASDEFEPIGSKRYTGWLQVSPYDYDQEEE